MIWKLIDFCSQQDVEHDNIEINILLLYITEYRTQRSRNVYIIALQYKDIKQGNIEMYRILLYNTEYTVEHDYVYSYTLHYIEHDDIL